MPFWSYKLESLAFKYASCETGILQEMLDTRHSAIRSSLGLIFSEMTESRQLYKQICQSMGVEDGEGRPNELEIFQDNISMLINMARLAGGRGAGIAKSLENCREIWSRLSWYADSTWERIKAAKRHGAELRPLLDRRPELELKPESAQMDLKF